MYARGCSPRTLRRALDKNAPAESPARMPEELRPSRSADEAPPAPSGMCRRALRQIHRNRPLRQVCRSGPATLLELVCRRCWFHPPSRRCGESSWAGHFARSGSPGRLHLLGSSGDAFGGIIAAASCQDFLPALVAESAKSAVTGSRCFPSCSHSIVEARDSRLVPG